MNRGTTVAVSEREFRHPRPKSVTGERLRSGRRRAPRRGPTPPIPCFQSRFLAAVGLRPGPGRHWHA